MALSCPELTGNYNSKTSLNHPRNNKNLYAVPKKNIKQSYSNSNHKSQSSQNQTNSVNTLDQLNKQQSNPASTQPENIIVANKIEYKTYLYARIDNPTVQIEELYSPASIHKDEVADFGFAETVYERADIIPIAPSNYKIADLKYSGTVLNPLTHLSANTQAQDTLYLKDGSKVVGKLVSKSKKEYKIQSSDGMVFSFTAALVEKVVLASDSSTNGQTKEGTEKVMEPYAKVGFIAALIGLTGNFIFIPLALYVSSGAAIGIIVSDIILLVGLVATLISMKKFKENPGKYKGKGLAKAQLIIWGIVAVFALILLLASGI